MFLQHPVDSRTSRFPAWLEPAVFSNFTRCQECALFWYDRGVRHVCGKHLTEQMPELVLERPLYGLRMVMLSTGVLKQDPAVLLLFVLPPGGVHRPIDFYNVSSVIDVGQEESRS